MAKFKNIPQLTIAPSYRTNVSWDYIESTIERWDDLDLNPDFQRGHVWTKEQQIAFVEFCLRGGYSSREILFNHPGWQTDYIGEMVIVDGKQRLEAVRAFMRNDIPAFGYLFKEYEDHIPLSNCDLVFCVNNLKTRAEVLQWYLEFNTGGTPHSNEEIQKVKDLLEKEKMK